MIGDQRSNQLRILRFIVEAARENESVQESPEDRITRTELISRVIEYGGFVIPITEEEIELVLNSSVQTLVLDQIEWS